MALVSGIQYSTEITGRRNAIINGDFDIWQRGTSQAGNNYGSDDRWNNSTNTTTKVHSQQTFTFGQVDVPNNPEYYSRTVVTSVAAAGAYSIKFQRIEGVDTFSGETVTLSFWAKADANKNIATGYLQYMGTGGTPSANPAEIGVTTHALTTTWQKFSTTATIPSVTGLTLGTDNNHALQFEFWFDAGSDFAGRSNSLGQQSGTFDIAQIQIEKGDVATEFERRSVGEELSLCQRYYEKSYNHDDDPGTVTTDGGHNHRTSSSTSLNTPMTIPFKIDKRAIPTITIYNGTTGATGTWRGSGGADLTISAITIGEAIFQAQYGGGLASQLLQAGHWIADAEL